MGEQAEAVWTEAAWTAAFERTRARAGAAGAASARREVVRACRGVMRAYTTGFYLVSRFLPRRKRDDVEVIYASVRYPDEVVDTFPLAPEEQTARLDRWARAYEAALSIGTLRQRLVAGIPFPLAAFADIVRATGLPAEHYRAFLGAMRLDVHPRPFATMDDLVGSYVYGSAVVVGFFLTYVYGASSPGAFGRALDSARELGIGLQLTNFLRDVAEDQRRGRCYLPADLLRAEGIGRPDAFDPAQAGPLARVVKRMAETARGHYAKARADLDAFAPDTRIAIEACIEVYACLNDRILSSDRGLAHRESVPMREKLRPLPASKYWRIPLAYLAR